MTHGVPISEEVLAKFRAEYLLSGNASEAARKVEIAESTGRYIGAKLNQDPTFSEDKRNLRATFLDECINARMIIMRKAKDRALADEADVYPHEHGLIVVDKRKEWADVVLNAEKNAHNLAKIEKENDGSGPVNTEVHIHLAKDDVEPSQEA